MVSVRGKTIETFQNYYPFPLCMRIGVAHVYREREGYGKTNKKLAVTKIVLPPPVELLQF